MSNTKNLTVTLSKEEHADLDFLVDYFQQQSISNVTKSDVVKFMIRQMKTTIERDKVEEVREVIESDGQ